MKNFTHLQKIALADALINGELTRKGIGHVWTGGDITTTHHHSTISPLIVQGYLEVKKSIGLGVAVQIAPTDKAVDCIHVSA